VPGISYPNPPLHDEVVTLRPWRIADLVSIAEAITDPAIKRWSHLTAPDAEALRRRLTEIPAEMAAGTAIRMLIVDPRDEETLLGAIAIFDINADTRTAEVGYWLVAGARGRGIASRALGLISSWGADELGTRAMVAICDLDNEASQSVLTRAGFQPHGLVAGSSPPALRYVLESE
jgi:RimJ/RimL family protein N-acetyltransferase